MTEITTENTVENQAYESARVSLIDYLFENMGHPATASDILKECPEIGSRKMLFTLVEEFGQLVRSNKTGKKDGQTLTSFTWWINDDQYAFDLWSKYLR